jgi:hypothetical protein
MKTGIVRLLVQASVISGLGIGSANALMITDTDSGLTLDTDPTIRYHQSKDDPCIIGNNDCKNPPGFLYTDANPGGSGTESAKDSPIYSIADITNVIGTTNFTVGIDFNDTAEPQILRYFSATYWDLGGVATQVGEQIFDVDDGSGGVTLKTISNGTGWTDFLLSGFAIDPLATHVRLRAEWYNNDGPDSFFLINANAVPVPTPDPTPVPEPGTLSLLGASLLGMAIAFRRRRVTKSA